MAVCLTGGSSAVAAESGYTTGKLDYAVRIDDTRNPYRVFGLFVMPGQVVKLDPLNEAYEYDFEITASAGEVDWSDFGFAYWQAPQTPGDYVIRIVPSNGGPVMRLNAFVMTPADEVVSGRLNGYRIGSYPSTRRDGLAIYEPPQGFVQVTPENQNRRVSPHFTVGQMLCKQRGGFPKYVALRQRLFLKLELLLERINAMGVETSELVIMSGYRTPAYNRSLGNVKYSRHQWGGAADIYVDVNPRDGRMDDLNRDGRVDMADANWLYRLIEGFDAQPQRASLVGGLGRYPANHAHGPFVHVDVRGLPARWGG